VVRRGVCLCLRAHAQVPVAGIRVGSKECWIRRDGCQTWSREKVCGPNPGDAISRVGWAGHSGLKGVRAQIVAPYVAFEFSVVYVTGSSDELARSMTVRGKLVFVGVVFGRIIQRVQRFACDGAFRRLGFIRLGGMLGGANCA
jgi:hypothetical protein